MQFQQWKEKVTEYLKLKDYKKISDFYESLIELEPDELAHYWYLGLSYLLQKEEEKAQLTWLLAFENRLEHDWEKNTQELITILDCEAERQVKEGSQELAWLIRGHAREISSENVVNLLKLIILDVELGHNISEHLETWQAIETVANSSSKDVPKPLLLNALRAVVSQPSANAIAFTEACLNYQDYFQELIDEIVVTAERKLYVNHIVDYAVDLIKACLQADPNNLKLSHKLYEFYATSKRNQQAIDVALSFYQKSKSASLPAQFVAIHQLLRIYLFTENWKESFSLIREHLSLLQKLLKNENIEFERYEKSYFPTTSQFYQYIYDDPVSNRLAINQISTLAQKQLIINHDLLSSNKSDCQESIVKDINKRKYLKIGYIGSTFHRHSVGWLCRWLIKYHDKDKFEVYIYSMQKYVDDLTKESFIEKANQFCAFDRSVGDAVKQIQKDNIDILIDLDGISSTLTFRVMLVKPAPIQVTWLGTDASGLSTIDYFVADRYVISKEVEKFYKEKLWFMPHAYLGIDGFEIGTPTLTRQELGIEKNETIFMNTQTSFKRHPDILRLQFKILKQVKNSHLLVKDMKVDNLTENIFQKLAEEEGVDYNRVHFLANTKTEVEHRANLRLADVILDTYPYNGATTTLESLWMELPIITKVGGQYVSRNSYTFMMNVGVTEGIAWTDEEYIEWGIKLGTDENLRKEIRWKLRQSKKISPLWKGKQFARDMEDAYRQMWEIHLQEKF